MFLWRNLVLLVLVLPPSLSAFGITVTDDRGKALTLAVPAQRIIALAPFISEIAYAAGAGGRLVGVARYSDYPDAAKNLAQIGDASRVDVERVLSLQPDLIIGWKTGNQVADIERLERFGFKVFVAEPTALAAIPRLLRVLGSLAGTEVTANSAADDFGRRIAALKDLYSKRDKVRVFYEIWHEPLMTVSGRHMISDVIRLCGGGNVFAAMQTLTPVVSLESVMAAQPEVVIGGSSATTPEDFAVLWARNERYAGLRNVKAMFVNPDWIQRQTPRILEGAGTVCQHLDAVRAARLPR